ncbi:MAG: DUF4349 domain-containing protein [Kiritimatiellia bacterium]
MNAIVRRLVLLLCLAALAAGCAAPKKKRAASAPMLEVALLEAGDPRYDRAPATDAVRDRLLAWKSSLSIEVADLTNAVDQAIAVVARHGGYLESRSDSTYGGTRLKLRIPASAFTNALGALESLGDVEARSVESEDVTEQYVDVEARLKNKLVLRDRLRQLLDRATAVKDVLAIETELNRVQGDVDSMEARIKALRGRVDFAVLELSLSQKPPAKILGPLGYLVKGLFWTVAKLFVIRE